MKRVNDDPVGELLFEAIGGTMYDSSVAINHGLKLPPNKFLFSTGVYINGYLQTDKGRRIEGALRKAGSFMIHLCADTPYTGASKEPIRLFPNPEINDEVNVPNDFFLPYYNCHGCTFADSQYWINPMRFNIDDSGRITPVSENIKILLEDEYVEVDSGESWNAAILINRNNEIIHAVKQRNGQVFSKYDGYQLEVYEDIEQVDISRYGNGNFKFYKIIE